VERWSSPEQKDEAALRLSMAGQPLPTSTRGLLFDRRVFDSKDKPGRCPCGQPAREGAFTCSQVCSRKRRNRLKEAKRSSRSALKRFTSACSETFEDEAWRSWLAGRVTVRGERLAPDDPRLEAVAFRLARACKLAALIDRSGRVVAVGRPRPEAAEERLAFIAWRTEQWLMRQQEQEPVA